jgi:hypothetical protein
MSDDLLANFAKGANPSHAIIKRAHPVPLKFPMLGNAILSVTIKDRRSSNKKRPVHMLRPAYEPSP